MFPLRTILHPTDFSPRSEHARRLALALARDHGAGLIVLHVVRPPAVLKCPVRTCRVLAGPLPECLVLVRRRQLRRRARQLCAR